MSKPIAVMLSDVHYDLNSLELADRATNIAINKANELNVPLIIAGDLHNTKANLRGECIYKIRRTLQRCSVTPYVMVGNHDKINEKSEQHALHFLEDIAVLVDEPMDMPLTGSHGIPYYHDVEELRTYLKTLDKGSTLIMHQGIQGSNAGEYFQDKSALRPEDVAGFRVISGHYHQRQTIQLPQGGTWDYVGNPYTVNFGEANDPPKGFQILYSDGSLEFVPTNLRKHVIIDCDLGYDAITINTYQPVKKGDHVWLKIRGRKENLARISKTDVQKQLVLGEYASLRYDSIPTDEISPVFATQNLTQPEILDSLIDSQSNMSKELKIRLKQTWKDLI